MQRLFRRRQQACVSRLVSLPCRLFPCRALTNNCTRRAACIPAKDFCSPTFCFCYHRPLIIMEPVLDLSGHRHRRQSRNARLVPSSAAAQLGRAVAPHCGLYLICFDELASFDRHLKKPSLNPDSDQLHTRRWNSRWSPGCRHCL